MKVMARHGLFLTVAFLVAGGVAAAQRLQGPVAVVTTAAPVFLHPDDSMTPLRELPAETIVHVQQTRGDWLQVSFYDKQFGTRIGWMQSRVLSVHRSEPAEVGVPATATLPRDETPTRRAEPDRPAPRPADAESPRRNTPAVRGFGSFAFDKESARETFEAVLGSNSIRSFGGGVQVTNLGGGLFAEASFERSSDTGERVFVFEENVYPLGIPLTVTQTPIDVAGGWRFATRDRVTPYVGGGVTFMRYQETSDLPETDDDLDVRKTGFVAFGGVEFSVARWVHIRGEARYRHINNVLGTDGVSGELGETTLGGIGGSLKVVIGR